MGAEENQYTLTVKALCRVDGGITTIQTRCETQSVTDQDAMLLDIAPPHPIPLGEATGSSHVTLELSATAVLPIQVFFRKIESLVLATTRFCIAPGESMEFLYVPDDALLIVQLENEKDRIVDITADRLTSSTTVNLKPILGVGLTDAMLTRLLGDCLTGGKISCVPEKAHRVLISTL